MSTFNGLFFVFTCFFAAIKLSSLSGWEPDLQASHFHIQKPDLRGKMLIKSRGPRNAKILKCTAAIGMHTAINLDR